MVMFTGSVKAGRQIAARAGERMIPCSLELGGKDAMVILDDADVDRAAAAAAWGSMLNAGQVCISVERAYVERGIYDQFVEKVVERVGALRVGMDGPHEFGRDVGAIATSLQMSVIADHVSDAVDRGAQILIGGHASEDGRFFEPTVLVDVDHSMKCMSEETFGPLLPIMKVETEDEAVRLANDSDFGLSASVWTRDGSKARGVASRLEVGAVNINNVLANLFQIALPMGGWKQSGMGSRLGGADGVLKFCRTQVQVSERLRLSSEPYWFPVSPKKGAMQARMIRLLGGNGWRRRIGRTGTEPAKKAR
jgi:acyl-CoA reductase-like NAD-dependent aldehyde dehydrogenase